MGGAGGGQCSFRKGISCSDQDFAVRQICEKMVEKHQEVFWAFMYLEKAYNRIDRKALWQVLGYMVWGMCIEGYPELLCRF